MRTVRSLLTQGNQKLGESIHVWSLPPVETCIGRSETCTRWCYAKQGKFLLPAVKARLRWNLEQAMRPDFVRRMVQEVRKRGCLVCRIHSAGDFLSVDYAEAWLWIIRACANTVFYTYTRSHVDSGVRRVLEEMALLDNAHVWYSCDRDIPPPAVVPPGVRTCYLLTEEGEPIPKVDLVFRVRRMRAKRVPLLLACPSEAPKGREIVCGSCTKCFR